MTSRPFEIQIVRAVTTLIAGCKPLLTSLAVSRATCRRLSNLGALSLLLGMSGTAVSSAIIGGKVTETCPTTPANAGCIFVLTPSGYLKMTDAGIRGPHRPKIPNSSVNAKGLPGAVDGIVPPGGSVTFKVDGERVIDGDTWIVVDVSQTAKLIGVRKSPSVGGLQAAGPPDPVGEGAIADLSIEAVVFDPVTNTYYHESIFDRLAESQGVGVSAFFPDLFADTNSDGVVGEGDLLYSLVDLNVYLNSIPSFALGDVFEIVNGTVAGLPGMMFSTTPFSFDDASGYDSGTPFTGTGETNSSHEVSAEIPIPSTLALLGVGLAALANSRPKRKQ